ncbi:hypothetical protein [Macrococcoides canis]|uniref:hypothetical protein n=1 Tax=Macrococcoides canis TaxID=1855823 RepID=UPI0020B785AB|nr:hypothetical protein [Macrococcus canis]
MTYTTNQIVRMIKDYQMNIKVVAKLRKEYIEDVCGANISQYGIEATMPNPKDRHQIQYLEKYKG